MDLKKTWDKLQQNPPFTEGLDENAIWKAMHQQSHGPVQKIRTGFAIKLVFIVVFTFVFIYIGIKAKEPLVSGLQFFMAGAYFTAFFLFLSQNKKIKAGIPMDESLLMNLKNYHAFVTKILRQEERIALFIYPVALTAGFLLGFTTGATIEEFFASRNAIILLVVCWIILTPLCHVLARWMNKVSFGKYLSELEGHIRELEKE